MERYSRQIILKDFGQQAQIKLSVAKVLVIGAGGLGCAALQYLAAAGVGHLGIVDDDVVALHNLHRQVLYSVDDIAYPKAIQAKQKLERLNPDIIVVAIIERLHQLNAVDIIKEYNIIIDATDNFSSRYLINDVCVLLKKPFVYGAVSQYEGQLAVFNFMDEEKNISSNYRDLFPIPPKQNEILNCAEAGVLGVLPGIIGLMQATEVIKLITHIGQPLINRLFTYNVLTNDSYELVIAKNEEARKGMPADEKALKEMNYELSCSSTNSLLELSVAELEELLKHEVLDIIDVREYGEEPLMKDFECKQIPLSVLQQTKIETEHNKLVVFCQTGKRSVLAANILKDRFSESKIIYSLKGGIKDWIKCKQKV